MSKFVFAQKVRQIHEGALIHSIVLFALTTLLPFCFLAAEQKKEQNKFEMYNGKIIRSISIEVRDIFDEPDAGSLYTTINGLKVNTREQVIRRELLMREGEAFDNFKLYETERVLRALRFLRNIELSVLPDGDFVDIKVRVQDTWTLIPKVGYSTGDGKEKKFIGIAESDLLGYGKRAELGYAEEDNRRTVQTVWEDPRLWGTKQRLAAAYLQRNDGELSFFSLDRPFRSFLDTYSWGIEGNDGDTIGRLFENGDEYYIYRQKLLDLGFHYTLSSARNPEDEVSRYSFGWAINNARFYNATLEDYEDLSLNPAELRHDQELLPDNRRYSGPTFLYEYVEPDFISSNYIDKFDRTEDYNLGIDFTSRLFFAPELTGSNNDSVLLTSNLAKGWRAGEGAFTRGELGLSSRLERGLGLQNSLLRTEWNFFKVFSPSFHKERFIGRHTFASAFSMDYGWELDKDRQFLLGADTGLRGYDARTFDGDKRFLLNIEDRIYLVEDVFRLVSLGAVVFADAGSTSYTSLGNMISDELYSDFGVGLRLAFPRSSGGQVVRMDLAFPTRDGPDGSRALEFRLLFAAGQVFSSHLSSEVLGSQAANAEVGFDR